MVKKEKKEWKIGWSTWWQRKRKTNLFEEVVNRKVKSPTNQIWVSCGWYKKESHYTPWTGLQRGDSTSFCNERGKYERYSSLVVDKEMVTIVLCRQAICFRWSWNWTVPRLFPETTYRTTEWRNEFDVKFVKPCFTLNRGIPISLFGNSKCTFNIKVILI
jgi:hypothetical protein